MAKAKINPEHVVKSAELALEAGDVEKAIEILRKGAKTLEYKDTDVLEALGDLLIAVDEKEEAESIYNRLLERSNHYSYYLNRAQARGPTPAAVADVVAAGNAIEAELNKARARGAGDEAALLGAAAAAAACQLAELWMTPPLSDDANAQSNACAARDTALQHGQNVPEVLATAARVHYVCSEFDAARELGVRAVVISAHYPGLTPQPDMLAALAATLLDLGESQYAAWAADQAITGNQGLLDAYLVAAKAYNDFNQYATARERLSDWLEAAEQVSVQAAQEVQRVATPILAALGDAANEPFEVAQGLGEE